MKNKFPFSLPLILDGATGTELAKLGYSSSECLEKWVLEHPEAFKKIQNSYIEAGANIVYAPTFGANRVNLSMYGLGDKVEDYNERLAALSKEVSNGRALVAGDMTALGLFLKPYGDSEFEDLVDVYREQAVALEKGGVDLFIIETISSIAETRAAIIAIKEVSDKPVFVTFTVNENGKTMMGTDAATALVITQSMGIDAFGLNCSTGPDSMLPIFERISRYASIPLIVKPNAGLPKIEDGKTLYDMAPLCFAKHTESFVSLGVSIFGGCCGTSFGHIETLSRVVRSLESKIFMPSPEEDEIIATSETDIHVLDVTYDIGEEVVCGPDLAEDILDRNDEDYRIIKIRIEDEDELEIFLENQYLMKLPVCIVSESPEIMEKAVRRYNGRAVFDNSSDLPPELIEKLSQSYGLIKL